MALELSINVSLSSNGKTMTFTETTGAYNVGTNPKGWGSPNAALTDVESAKLDITTPNGTSKTLFYTKGQFYGAAFSPNFPDATETYTFNVTTALNSTYSLSGISSSTPSAGFVRYTTFVPSNFTTSNIISVTGSNVSGYNVVNKAVYNVFSVTQIDTVNSTTTPHIETNPKIFSTNTSTSAFDDGIYTFVYTVYTPELKDSIYYTTTFYLLVTTAIACCVDKLFHLASQADCTDCKNEKLAKALEAESYLKAAEYAAACGKINMANKHLAKAQWICSEQNCLNC